MAQRPCASLEPFWHLPDFANGIGRKSNAILFATLAALVAAKGVALIAVDKGRFDGLPRPTQID